MLSLYISTLMYIWLICLWLNDIFVWAMSNIPTLEPWELFRYYYSTLKFFILQRKVNLDLVL